jgi:glycosyltransferase involved in cell wall biosynthesis
MKRIQVAVDGRPLCTPLAGIGNYVYETLNALSTLEDLDIKLYCAPGPPITPVPPSWGVRVTNLPRQVALRFSFSRWLSLDNPDVFWATQTLLPHTNTQTVVTAHDLNHLIAPETMSWGTRLAHRLWYESDLARATRVVTNSQGTSERLQKHFGRKADAIATPGVSDRFRRLPISSCTMVLNRYRLRHRDFLFAIGTREPRKNLETLVGAHRALFEATLAPVLVIAGGKGWGADLVESPSVRILGYVPEDDLPALLSSASALVIPSIYEGYGMPAAEARACGTRIVATDIPELHESAGPDAIFVAPSESGIKKGILEILNKQEPMRCHRPSWRATATVYLTQFAELASLRSKQF